jgi:hypothetical protein
MLITVGPWRLQVLECHNLYHPDGRKVDGYVDYARGTIWLEAGLGPAAQAPVLWHELVHVLGDLTAVDLDERGLDALAFALVDLIQRNPALAVATAGIHGLG